MDRSRLEQLPALPIFPECLLQLTSEDRDVVTKYVFDYAQQCVESLLKDSQGEADEYPACSGDAGSCPENEGYGCCKPNPQPSPPDAVQLEAVRTVIAKMRHAVDKAEAGKLTFYDPDTWANELDAALSATPEPQRQAQGDGRYRPELGVYDEASLRAAGRAWEALQYISDADESGDANHEEINRRQVAIERAIDSHTHFIDENDHYVLRSAQAPHQDRGEIARARAIIDHVVHGERGSDALHEAHDLLTAALTEAKQQGSGEVFGWAMFDEAGRYQTTAITEMARDALLYNGDGVLPKWTARTLYTTPPQGEAKQQAPAAVPDGMLLIQKTDAECLVRDAERFIGIREGTVGGRLARKRVRALLAATPAASEGESRNG